MHKIMNIVIALLLAVSTCFASDIVADKVTVNSNIDTQIFDPVFTVVNNNISRIKVRPSGTTEWSLFSGTGESGKFYISTPGGGIGIGMFPGWTPDAASGPVRFDMATFMGSLTKPDDTISADKPGAVFIQGFNKAYYQAYSVSPAPTWYPSMPQDTGIAIQQFDNFVGINTLSPKARLEIKDGGLRINNESKISRPACNATTRGTFWVTSGDPTKTPPVLSDSVAVCLWKSVGGVDSYTWKTIVSSGNDEHENTMDGNIRHKDN